MARTANVGKLLHDLLPTTSEIVFVFFANTVFDHADITSDHQRLMVISSRVTKMRGETASTDQQ